MYCTCEVSSLTNCIYTARFFCRCLERRNRYEDVPAVEDFLCGKAAVLGVSQKERNIFVIFAGDRKYKITRLDPMEIKEMSVSDGPSQAGFSLTIRDMKMHGLKDALIRKTE